MNGNLAPLLAAEEAAGYDLRAMPFFLHECFCGLSHSAEDSILLGFHRINTTIFAADEYAANSRSS